MHGTLFVGISRENAKSSLIARKLTCSYLDDEGFTPMRQFGGFADHYQIGGRCSGYLELLKLKYDQTKHFAKFWKQHARADNPDQCKITFKNFYPKFVGRIPVGRVDVPRLGYPDDAEIMDEALYTQLKRGFSDSFNYSWGLDETPCVLYRDSDADSQWPEDPEDVIGKIWVVVVDYHY